MLYDSTYTRFIETESRMVLARGGGGRIGEGGGRIGGADWGEYLMGAKFQIMKKFWS